MAAPSTLQRVQAALHTPSVQQQIATSFGEAALESRGAFQAHARATVAQLGALLASEHGLRLASLKQSEVARIAKDAVPSASAAFSSSEFKALVEALTKYAALKARRRNARRWGLGLTLSAAGATAATAAVFTSPALLLVAAPAGAAVGAVAVLADGAKVRRSDRRAATRPAGASPSGPAEAAAPTPEPTAAAAAPAGPAESGFGAAAPAVSAFAAAAAVAETEQAPAEIQAAAVEAERADEAAARAPVPAVPAAAADSAPAPPVDAEPEAAPAQLPAPHHAALAPASDGDSSPRGSGSEDLVSAVVEVLQPADAATPADAPKAAAAPPAPAAAHPAAADEAAAVDAGLPALVQSATPEPKDLDDVPMADFPSHGSGRVGTAALPPLPLDKAGSGLLRKNSSLRQSFKGLKKALSINNASKKAGAGAGSGSQRPSDAGSEAGSLPDAPPSSTRLRSGKLTLSFGRRRSSDASDATSGSNGADLVVEPRQGSATLKKLGDKLRRSFTLERDSASAPATTAARHATTAA